jgi:uncharacterized alpha/beta hydrolase family protein
MKKKLSIVAAAGCALALAAPATADQTIKYKGKADPGGRVAFKLVKGGGKKQIDKFKWAKIPVDCGGKGDQTTSNKLGFMVKVKANKTFSTKAVLGPTSDPEAKVKIEGSVAGKSATGTMHIRGKALPLDNGKTGDCKSGLVDWNASRK